MGLGTATHCGRRKRPLDQICIAMGTSIDGGHSWTMVNNPPQIDLPHIKLDEILLEIIPSLHHVAGRPPSPRLIPPRQGFLSDDLIHVFLWQHP
ncbi:hypothetical protein TIFTF001_040053 [Ficus carica]|uniref:Uncharacterized protein n=1 Tax=Ficus carica TaxID=3494 RepID=A0AA87YXU4_FICCA|nr:hypothetical protein TIFTF001_040053 [Ficus carica]